MQGDGGLTLAIQCTALIGMFCLQSMTDVAMGNFRSLTANPNGKSNEISSSTKLNLKDFIYVAANMRPLVKLNLITNNLTVS